MDQGASRGVVAASLHRAQWGLGRLYCVRASTNMSSTTSITPPDTASPGRPRIASNARNQLMNSQDLHPIRHQVQSDEEVLTRFMELRRNYCTCQLETYWRKHLTHCGNGTGFKMNPVSWRYTTTVLRTKSLLISNAMCQRLQQSGAYMSRRLMMRSTIG